MGLARERCSGPEPPPWPCLSPGGLASEKDYPFRGSLKRHKCLASNYKKVAWIQDFIMLQNNEQSAAGGGGGGTTGRGQAWGQDDRDRQTDQDRGKKTGLETEMEAQSGGGGGEPRAKSRGHTGSRA